MQVDPLAALDNSKSPFAYSGNNPVVFNDPLGLLTSAVGYTDGQLRTMYRRDRAMGGPTNFGDWAVDNLDSFGSEGRTIQGTDGNKYSFNPLGQFGYWKVDARSWGYDDEEGVAGVEANKDIFVTAAASYMGRGIVIDRAINGKAEPTLTDVLLAGVGTAAFVGEKLSDIIIKSRSGFTSGKLIPGSPIIYSKQAAKNIKFTAKGFGMFLTLWSIYNTQAQFKNGEIDEGRRRYNHLNNGVGVLCPQAAIPLAVGDYYGQTHADEIVNDMTQPGGFTFEVTKFMLELLGVPTGAPKKK